MTQAHKKQIQEKKREYQRKWYAKNRAKQMNAQSPAIPMESAKKSESIPFHTIINAYYVLYESTTDVQIRADLNKVLSSIISKQ